MKLSVSWYRTGGSVLAMSERYGGLHRGSRSRHYRRVSGCRRKQSSVYRGVFDRARKGVRGSRESRYPRWMFVVGGSCLAGFLRIR